ncbi:unnamed protein product [Adineta steineri]|uniref:RRM domain-containing protein n=1 Tax=Adineta steineri TaxID=433720 RepID=A0A818RVU9_9BILA|nr:unnamed protein product [Adineta steineri]CAF3659431.1 unnamed protein product [Adineta steineri]
MDRYLSIPCYNQFVPMHHNTYQLNENSSKINQHKSYIPSSEFDKIHSSSTLNHHLLMPSYDQFSSMHERFFEEDHPLRIHVGNIPFLWTVNDLCKQFQIFGPIKDPEIVSNERGSKGFGFITFLRHDDGINAIRVKNGSIADGRKITVALASSRSSNRINSCHCHCSTIN